MEFEGYPSLIIFLEGCSLKCAHCFNKELWTQSNEESYDDLYETIDKCLPFIDGIIISGGEPLEQPIAVRSIITYAKSHNLKIKLNTNGCHPEELEKIIDLIDKVRIDYKPWMSDRCDESIKIVREKLEYAETWNQKEDD
jgi:pyruvate formate lyase activating enzyme